MDWATLQAILEFLVNAAIGAVLVSAGYWAGRQY